MKLYKNIFIGNLLFVSLIFLAATNPIEKTIETTADISVQANSDMENFKEIFSNKNFAKWAATPGVKIIKGDFNGDGKMDIALVRQQTGWSTIPIAFSNGDGTFRVTNQKVGKFAGWATASGVKIITGHFNNDKKMDIALVRQQAGWSTIPIAFSNGDGTFRVTNQKVGKFAKWAATPGVKIITGSFGYSHRTDIALVRQQAGWSTIPIAYSSQNGTLSITNEKYGKFPGWAATSGVKIIKGDFNGDRMTDLALVRQKAGWTTIPMLISRGGGYSHKVINKKVGKIPGWAATSGVKIVTGDFNGDYITDIALVRQQAGWTTIPMVCFVVGPDKITNKKALNILRWATPGVKVISGKLDGNRTTDMLLIRKQAGWSTIPVACSNGDGSFLVSNNKVGKFAGWAAASGVKIIDGDFNGDGKMDLVLVRQKAGWSTIPVAFSNGNGTFRITNK